MMLLSISICISLQALLFTMIVAVQYPSNPILEMSAEKSERENKTIDVSDENSNADVDLNEEKEKIYLDDAMQIILDPTTVVTTQSEEDVVESRIKEIDVDNVTLEHFMHVMDNLSLELCKTSQTALWSFVTDISNVSKKNKMIRISAEEEEVKRQYWNIFKKRFLNNDKLLQDRKMRRKIRIIKERGTNVQMPPSKQREEIDTMQRIWSRVTVCVYNDTCNAEDSVRTMSDIVAIFKSSNDSKQLAYYWKAFRDETGKKIRPIFKNYVIRMNKIAKSENFTDAGDMWRYAFEDDFFVDTVERLWREVKPLYDSLHDYVRIKLKAHFTADFKIDNNLIPAHLLGNLWAQEWQAIYPKVAAFKNCVRPNMLKNGALHSQYLFDSVDDFHQSIGFESTRDSFKAIKDTMTTANCLPSSHDMCDGIQYKIKWCGEKVTDVSVGLYRAARLLGHVQYFKHYRHLPPLFRDGPTPAFHDALSDITAVQVSSPDHLKNLSFVNINPGPAETLNHLLWVALEKVPIMGYAYVLDKWRWDVFGNSSIENWNQHWWNLRMKETGISAPVPRDESNLDPASKYHVVSHVQYITYLISHVLEFQILLSLCKKVNQTGPLHECNLYGAKEAGRMLSAGMSLGASEDWRTVLKAMTGETELSSEGILTYFAPLQQFLKEETARLTIQDIDDMDKNAPIIVGIIVVVLTIVILALYCVKKYGFGNKVFNICGLAKNGSLDIVTSEIQSGKTNEIVGISEDKV